MRHTRRRRVPSGTFLLISWQQASPAFNNASPLPCAPEISLPFHLTLIVQVALYSFMKKLRSSRTRNTTERATSLMCTSRKCKVSQIFLVVLGLVGFRAVSSSHYSQTKIPYNRFGSFALAQVFREAERFQPKTAKAKTEKKFCSLSL